MPEHRDDIDSRWANLLGAFAGITTDEASRVPAMAAEPLRRLVHIGHTPYDRMTYGEALDAETLARVRRIRRAMGAPRVPIERGPITALVNQQEIVDLGRWLREKFPAIGEAIIGKGEFAPTRIMSKYPSVPSVAHEMGHSIPSPIARLGAIDRLISPIGLRGIGVGGGIAAALSENERLQDLAPFIAGAGAAPEVLEEIRASGHALKGIARAEGGMSALRSAGRLAPALGTYIAGAIPAILAPMVAEAVKEYIQSRKKKNQKKEAAEEPKPPKATGRKILTARQEWSHPAPKPKVSKVGKPGTPPAKPPSKRKFYKDMLSQMSGKGTRKDS